MRHEVNPIVGVICCLITIVGVSCSSPDVYPKGKVYFTTGDDGFYCFSTEMKFQPSQILFPLKNSQNQKREFRNISIKGTRELLIETEWHEYPPDYQLSLITHEWSVHHYEDNSSTWNSVFSSGKKNEYLVQTIPNQQKTVLTDGYLGFTASPDGKLLATIDLIKNKLCIMNLKGQSPQLTYYNYPFDQHCPRPRCFSPDESKLYFSGTVVGKPGFSIVIFDLKSSLFNIWRNGASPIISSDGNNIAYLNESNNVVVANVMGVNQYTFNDLRVDELEQWIDDRFLMALKAKTESHGRELIVFIDMQTHRIKEFDVSKYGGIFAARFIPTAN
jgi:hypothetical protein